MRKAALVALGAVVLVVQLAADVLGGFRLDDLPLDGVGEEAVEAILAVAHVEVDAGVVAPLNMELAALLTGVAILRLAFADCEVLIGAEAFDLL